MQVNFYYGSGKSRDEYMRLALMKIPQALRDNEAELRQQRWFDYRHLTPAEATYLFAAEYRHAYVEAYKRQRDIRTAEHIRPFAPDDIFACKELNAMWQVRQAADSIGCKYDFYLRFVFDRFAQRGWRYLPRPNQMASEELVLDIRDAWHIECAASLQVAELALYRAAAYNDTPEQNQYYDWLCMQIMQRNHPHLALARVVYDEPILPATEAVKRVPPALLSKAAKFQTNI